MKVRFHVLPWDMLDNVTQYLGAWVSVQRSAGCSFEKDTCMFVTDTSKTATWRIVHRDEKKVDVKRPDFDHTTMTGTVNNV